MELGEYTTYSATYVHSYGFFVVFLCDLFVQSVYV